MAVGVTLTHGKVIGTDGDDDVFLSTTDNQQSYLVGGAGADHLIGYSEKAATVIEGGDGRDVIGSSAYHTAARPRPWAVRVTTILSLIFSLMKWTSGMIFV